jgi:hypothetical protein
MKKNYYYLLFGIIMLSVSAHQVKSQSLESDSLALVTLYNECGGANWIGFDTWLNGPIATWKDVVVADVNSTPRVTNVLFKNMTLTGTLPEELGNITEMAGKIELNNQPGLTGTVPAFIWTWTKVDRLQIKACGYTAFDLTGIENMVNLYEINTQGTPFTGEIPVEFFNLPLMRDVYLHECAWSSLPADLPIPTITPLKRLYLNNNEITNLPDLTGMLWHVDGAKIAINNNMLTFEDIEPNMAIATAPNVSSFTISPQATVGEDATVYAFAGSTVTIESNIDNSPNNIYNWFLNSIDNGPVADTKDLVLTAFDTATQSGSYFCIAQNANVPGLDITTALTTVMIAPIVSDSLALVALYNECGGANWVGFETWLTGPIATWKDVTVADVNGVQRVTNVLFKNMTLTGVLPEDLANLTEMSGKIELNNQPGLTGTVPAFIWTWTKVTQVQIKFCNYTAFDLTGIENMLLLKEINTQGTPFTGEIPVEFFNLPLMSSIYLEDGMWSSLPANLPIPTPTPLTRFYINGNQIADLPDLSGMVWGAGTKIKFRNNLLTFDDLEPNMAIASNANVSTFEISPQAIIGEKETITVNEGELVSMSVTCGGSQNSYSWFKNGELVEGADQSTLEITSPIIDDSGEYQCIVQSPLVPGLDILSDTITLVVNINVGVGDVTNSFRINGNPVLNILSIDATAVVESLTIIDLSGRVVKSAKIASDRIRLDITDIKNGIYLISLNMKNTSHRLKFIKK